MRREGEVGDALIVDIEVVEMGEGSSSIGEIDRVGEKGLVGGGEALKNKMEL